jgi:hypothetical protein
LPESRTGKRFPLSLPIHLRPKTSAKRHAGTTKNVSAAGVYIQADSELQIGTPIEFDITLPAVVVGADKDVEIRCKGRVVRMDKAKGKAKKSGLACVIDNYKFVRKN